MSDASIDSAEIAEEQPVEEIAQDVLEVAEHLEDVIAIENEDAVFECKVECKLQPKCLWYKDGRLVNHTWRTRISNSLKWHRLEISSVNTDDQGVYTLLCVGCNNSVSSRAVLHVTPKSCVLDKVFYTNAAPVRNLVVTRHLSNVRIKVKERVELEVHVHAEENIMYTWFRNNQIVIQNERIIQLDSNRSSFLSIHKAELDDSGIYFVVIESNLTIASSIAAVEVLEEAVYCSDSETLPYIEEDLPDELDVNETEEVRLICQATFNMDTTVEWLKNQIPVGGNNFVAEDYGSHYIGLRILNPSRSDSGDYTIKLSEDTTGRVDSTTCYLNVNSLPKVSVPNVTLKRALESGVGYCGARLSFDCGFHLEDSKYFFVVWYVGHIKVQRTNSRFIVGCEGGEFMLYINKLEPAMCGEVRCELRRALAYRKSMLINSTSAFLTVIPPRLAERYRGRPRFRNGKVHADKPEGVSINEDKIKESGNMPQAGATCSTNVTRPVDDLVLEILYCGVEEDGSCFLHSSRGSRIVTSQLRMFERKAEPTTKRAIVIEWHDSTPSASVWYTIEVGLTYGGYLKAGESSVPWFEINDPKIGHMLRFRVKAIPRLSRNESFVTIEPPTGEVERPRRKYEVKVMELFNRVYTDSTDVIGTGAFGNVILIKNKAGEQFAAKILRTRTQRKRDIAIREYEIMKSVHHPKLVQLNDAFIARDTFILVMDFLWGGELFERMVEEEHFKEVDVVLYVQQICEGLLYLHQRKIAHLDLKPENIVCMSPNSGQVKIIDFGLARVIEDGEVTRALYGTRDYVAPEVLNFESLSPACDMWSLGVVTYMLLSGIMPFAGDTWAERSANIVRINFNYEDSAFTEVSPLAINFVDQLLVSSDRRMNAPRALRHKWIVEGPPKTSKAGFMKKARVNLKSYLANNRARWQRAGNVMIAAMRLRAPARPQTEDAAAKIT